MLYGLSWDVLRRATAGITYLNKTDPPVIGDVDRSQLQCVHRDPRDAEIVKRRSRVRIKLTYDFVVDRCLNIAGKRSRIL